MWLGLGVLASIVIWGEWFALRPETNALISLIYDDRLSPHIRSLKINVKMKVSCIVLELSLRCLSYSCFS